MISLQTFILTALQSHPNLGKLSYTFIVIQQTTKGRSMTEFVVSLLLDTVKGQLLNNTTAIVESGVIKLVRNQVFNKEAGNVKSAAVANLQKGDELCKGRIIPMSPAFLLKVKDIYEKCQWQANYADDTPLMLASSLGLVHMVWGFIECAKQSNTNLHTRKIGELQNFLWLRNLKNQTALDVAIANDHVDIAKLLLNNATNECLEEEWDSKGKTLLPLLRDPKFDRFIFNMLGRGKRAGADPPTSIEIHDQQEGSITHTKSIKYLNKFPISQRIQGRESLDRLDHGLLELNPNKSTILHLASRFGDVNYVDVILEEHQSQIHCLNSDGETPAYVAAREGHVDILESIINSVKGTHNDIESLLIRSTDQHNALHVAIQNHHVGVVFWLIENFPQLANRINSSNESPVYIAAERKYFVILEEMLKKCNEIAFEGPKGKTALHAAATSNSLECVEYLLEKKPSLLNMKDEKDWTPFRYAVEHNSSLATKELLNADYTIGYQLMTEDGITTSAIHIAAGHGYCETMEVLIYKCIGCSEFIDEKGRNILHLAVENMKTNVIEFIFQDESLTNLINQKDRYGNTPIHLLVTSDFELMVKLMDSRVDINVLNKQNSTPLDKASSNEEKERLLKGITLETSIYNKTNALFADISKRDSYGKELKGVEEEWAAKEKKSVTNFKIVDSLVLVATLIATATFAAAFTVPGGFDSNSGSKQGTPYLLKKSAFQAFAVTNAIAFSSACSVLLGHVFLLFYRNHYDEADEKEQEYIDNKIMLMYSLTGLALLAMTIAFITGLYVVLTPSHALAIIICVISLAIIIISFRPMDLD